MQQSEPSMFWKNTNVCNEYTCMHRALFWVLVEKYFSSTTRALLHSIFQLFVPDRGDICQRHWPRTDSGQTCFTKSLKCNLMGLKGKVHIWRKQWWKVTSQRSKHVVEKDLTNLMSGRSKTIAAFNSSAFSSNKITLYAQRTHFIFIVSSIINL